MKQITKDDIWDTSKCDLICTHCGSSFGEAQQRCDGDRFVSVVLLREVLEGVDLRLIESMASNPNECDERELGLHQGVVKARRLLKKAFCWGDWR